MIIKIPFRAISVNTAYCANKKFGMKAETRKWCYEINMILNTYEKEFERLKDEFDVLKFGLKVSMTFYYENFYTKTGTISANTIDVDNCIKILQDLIFGKDNYGSLPYKCHNLSIDDKFITTLTSKKLPSDRDWFTVQIELEELP